MNFNRKLKYMSHVSRNGLTISLDETRKEIQVLERERSLKEGWWMSTFKKTPNGRKRAFNLFEKLKRQHP